MLSPLFSAICRASVNSSRFGPKRGAIGVSTTQASQARKSIKIDGVEPLWEQLKHVYNGGCGSAQSAGATVFVENNIQCVQRQHEALR
jgi:hypothetical protein